MIMLEGISSHLVMIWYRHDGGLMPDIPPPWILIW